MNDLLCSHAPRYGMMVVLALTVVVPARAQVLTIPDFQVNENVGGTSQGSSVVSMDENGQVICVWVDSRDGDFDIFRVNDDLGGEGQGSPAIAADEDGNFVIAWSDGRDGTDRTIYAQRYADDGAARGGNFKVNGSQEGRRPWAPAVASDSDGRFVVTWSDARNGHSDIYAQRYAPDGTVVGPIVKVTAAQGPAYYSLPDVSMWNSRIYTTWTEDRTT